MGTRDAVLLLAHGTIADNSELEAFLTVIRRGRPPGESLLRDMAGRYDAIGGSPLLHITREQARLLELELGVPCSVAMRLWKPRVEDVLPGLLAAGAERVCLFPLAPFSVDVYVTAAREAASRLGAAAERVRWLAVPPWGTDPAFIAAHADLIRPHLRPGDGIVVSAHSLPLAVIRGGDRYAEQVEACAAALSSVLGLPLQLAYQSQGDGGGEWLGPDLPTVFERLRAAGCSRIVLAPFGFLGDHVETLYDLDIDAQATATAMGLTLVRVPALNTDPRFIAALAGIARRALA